MLGDSEGCAWLRNETNRNHYWPLVLYYKPNSNETIIRLFSINYLNIWNNITKEFLGLTNIQSTVVLFAVFNCAEKCAVLLLNALDILLE